MSELCIVQVLDYEAQVQAHLKKKRILECKNCPIECKKKGGGPDEEKQYTSPTNESCTC